MKFNVFVLTVLFFSILFISNSFAASTVAKPDLTIGTISFQNTLIQTIPNTLNIEVKNTGTASSGITSSLYVSITNSNQSPTFIDILPTSQGQTTVLQLNNVTINDGSTNTSIYVFADIKQSVPESNERNNNATKVFINIQPNKPDFAIKNIVLNPTQPIEGEPFNVVVTIQNNSAVPYNSAIELHGKNFTKNYDQTLVIDGLNANESKQLVFENIIAPPGIQYPTVSVDPGNKIAEITEANNRINFDFSVNRKFPNLIVSNIAFEPTVIGVGDAVKVFVTIKNIGNKETINGFFTKINVKGAEPINTVIAYNNPIAPNQEISLDAATIKITKSSGKVTAIADYTNLVIESNESDNTKTIEFATK